MLFRQRDDGGVFPPIIPNGDFLAIPPGAHQKLVVFQVRETGLHAPGLNVTWGEIAGVSIIDRTCFIVCPKYASGGLRFQLGSCELRQADGQLLRIIDGYPVEYCLMNRVTFEAQRLRSSNSRQRQPCREADTD